MSLIIRFKKLSDLFNKASVFYSPKSANYWHTITPCGITRRPGDIGRYYLDFSTKINYAQNKDENGIPLFEYLNEIPETYHPIAICQYALGLYDVYIAKACNDEDIKDRFLAQSDWLLNNAVISDGSAVWYFNYPDKRYGIKPPWCSAMAQGEAISVLCRAFKITGKDDYINFAEKALLPFKKEISDGGVRNYFKGIVLYEEFPSDDVTGVLNGFMFSLFGLYDLYLLNGSKTAITLFHEGAESIKSLLKYYDTGYWSRYDLFKYPLSNPASYTYHELHVQQLKVLYILTEEEIFLEYSEKWQRYEKGVSRKTRALINKFFYLKKIKAI